MRYLTLLTFAISMIFALTIAPQAEESQEHKMPPPYEGSKELQQMKQLAGTWTGTHKMGDMDHEIQVTYETTANGSAVIEKSFPGTSHEMVSVYYDDADTMTMVHYCALNNQPKMAVANSADGKIDLKFKDGSNIDPEKTPHMHDLSITFKDDNTVVQEWTMYGDGKEAGSTVITLTRAPEEQTKQ